MAFDRPLARLQYGLATSVRLLDKALFLVTSVLLVALVVILFMQVVFRYVIERSLPWSEEGARFILVWMSILAACMAARQGQHFLFRWFTFYLRTESRFWLRRLCDLLTILILALIFRYSLVYLEVVAHQTAPGTGVNMRVPYAGVSVGVGLLLYIYVCETIDTLLSRVTGGLMTLREQLEDEVAAVFTSGLEGRAEKK
jgi:TRAP-type C4-dicarboxylate transport system permease small subunit